jgi:glycosyltransferase involved in cell wall biosynthesis
VRTRDASAVRQLAEALALGDGVTAIVRRAADILATLGEPPGILAHRKWVPDAILHETRPCHEILRPADPGLVFHYWGHNSSTWVMDATRGRRAIWYHNVTPPRFFRPGEPLHALTARGYTQLAEIACRFDLLIGDSRFNVESLARYLRRPRPALHIYPVVEPDEERAAPVDDALVARLRAEPGTKCLFIGRIARNKRQDAVMRAFDAYRSRFDPRAQLWLVGSEHGDPAYRAELERLRSGLEGGTAVTLTGKVSDAALRAYLRAADVLVCASEHEGFGIPLAQAMALDVPVIARAAAAVAETLGAGGVLVRDWDPREVAELIHAVQGDPDRRSELLARQRASVVRFSFAEARARLEAVVRFLRQGTPSAFFEPVSPPEAWSQEARVGAG